ncbi:YhbD family protein [Bacillus sonorensis]|uniref:YhbD family protein n=1 Tax=Bacillus sonorensis TaxID=119858 RepID=UPI0022826526|nr:YhbD family protein [Bacillus sonorensis]MCY8032869.1 YhbD family protein [Bacillus sonorensis]MCY8564023.1 YhbD family protein [Bacillus sonorensis]
MAHDDLISKKELLDLTSISYGQLYRWKRKNLIPEEWFIRKSTFTGQETFFPKADILNRIKKIQSMKENLSLDEMAEMFSPKLDKLDISRGELLEKGLISEAVMSFFVENTNKRNDSFGLGEVLAVYVLEGLLQSGEINLEEGKMVLEIVLANGAKNSGRLIVLRKLGVATCFIAEGDIVFEKAVKVVADISLSEAGEELKTKLM